MSAAAGERTEKATSRRRQRAKDQGQFAYSQELTSAITTGACVATVFYYLQTPTGFRAFFEGVLESVTTADNPEAILGSTIRQAGLYFLAVSAPVFIAAVIAALAGNFLQGLPVFARDAATLKWERLNPISGLSRLKTQTTPEGGAVTLAYTDFNAVLKRTDLRNVETHYKYDSLNRLT